MPWKLSGSGGATEIALARAFAAKLPHQLDGLGQGELLAGETRRRIVRRGLRRAVPCGDRCASAPTTSSATSRASIVRRNTTPVRRSSCRATSSVVVSLFASAAELVRKQLQRPTGRSACRPSRRRRDHLPQCGKRIARGQAMRDKIGQSHFDMRAAPARRPFATSCGNIAPPAAELSKQIARRPAQTLRCRRRRHR